MCWLSTSVVILTIFYIVSCNTVSQLGCTRLYHSSPYSSLVNRAMMYPRARHSMNLCYFVSWIESDQLCYPYSLESKITSVNDLLLEFWRIIKAPIKLVSVRWTYLLLLVYLVINPYFSYIEGATVRSEWNNAYS